MVRFLTTAGTAAEIQRLVRGAREEITLVSPYLQLSRDLAERLFAAKERGVHVRLVYGKDRSIQKNTRERLARLAGLRLFYATSKLRGWHAPSAHAAGALPTLARGSGGPAGRKNSLLVKRSRAKCAGG